MNVYVFQDIYLYCIPPTYINMYSYALFASHHHDSARIQKHIINSINSNKSIHPELVLNGLT